MDQQQQDLRRAAAKAFMESLEQLQETFAADAKDEVQLPAEVVEMPTEPEPLPDEAPFDLTSFEQAVADIEQFMQARQQQDEQLGKANSPTPSPLRQPVDPWRDDP